MGKCLGLLRFNQQTRFTIHYDICQWRNLARHHRFPGRHCLDYHLTETLRAGSEGKYIQSMKEGRNLALKTDKSHLFFKTQAVDERLQISAVSPGIVPSDKKGSIGHEFKDTRHG